VNAPTETWVFNEGDTFNRFYRVEKRLGAGLHGEVYLVEHLITHDRFALKIMHLEDVREASRVARAMSTAKASYWIRHANVVRIHDIGCEPDGKVWILMEYLEGQSVGELLSRQQGRVSLWLALHIAIEAAWGLDAAHEMGVIHRDIKPDNLWLTADGMLKVLDFSLAKVVPEGVRTTQRSQGVGTPPYMGPEMLTGGVVIDARADVYALGMLLWQMLAGRHPFHDALNDTKEMVRRQLYVDPTSLSAITGLPAYVDEFLARAVAKDPAKRFLTMAQMARGLMTLRDQLKKEAASGLIDARGPRGEPQFSEDPSGRQAYVPVQTVTPTGTVPPVPGARVVLASQVVAPGLGGTLPLPSARSGTTLQRWPPSAPPAAALAPMPSSAPTSAPAGARGTPHDGAAPSCSGITLRSEDTPQAVIRVPTSSEVSHVPPARPARRLVAVALASALLASAGVASWSRWARRAVAQPTSADTASTATVPVQSAQPVAPVSLTTAPPSAANVAAAPTPAATTTTAPAPTPSVPAGPSGSGRPGTRRGSAPALATTAPPPPAPAPTVPAARHRLFDADP
jgi:serine/threonine-protein kinase